MAINPATKYVGKIQTPSTDYPYGAARNITTPSDGTGTPWEEDLINDIFGWQQSLLSAAKITPSGTPEKATASQYVDSINLLSSARALNAPDSEMVLSTDTTTPVGTGDGVTYLFDTVSQLIYELPSGIGSGETIASVSGTDLTTNAGSYTLTLVDLSGATEPTTLLQSEPELIAHRGFRGVSVENTLHAIISSLRSGADSVEFDVQTTSDNIPYVFHDTTVDALTDGTGTFTSLTSTYIDGLTYTAAAGTIFDGIGIPKLSDVVSALAKVDGKFYPEIKAYANVADIDVMVNIVKDADLSDRCVWQSFTLTDLTAARDVDSTPSFGYLINDNLAGMQSAVDSIENEDGSFMLLAGYSNVLSNPSIVEYAKSRGIDIGVWTVPTVEEYKSLLDIGVFKIMSDNNYKGY